MLVGTPALRMTGLFLAVTTLALAVAAPWLLSRPVFTDDPSLILLPRQQWLGISLASQRAYYYVCLGALALAIVAMARIRRSGLGRTMLAVRDNEQAAAALGLSPVRTKLVAFGISGFLAGLAGGLFGGLLVSFEPGRFLVIDSLSVVAIAVVGGLASITGTVLGALLIIGFPAFFPDNPEVALLTSGAGILLLLLYLPGGLVQILYGVRDLLLGWVAGRRPEPGPPRRCSHPGRRPPRAPRAARRRRRSRRRRRPGPLRDPGGGRRRRPAGRSGRGGRPHRGQRGGQVDPDERDRRLRARRRAHRGPRHRRHREGRPPPGGRQAWGARSRGPSSSAT